MNRDRHADRDSSAPERRSSRAARQAGNPDVPQATDGVTHTYYERHLPHQVPRGYPIFLTWNLKGSLPKRVIRELEYDRERLEREPKRHGESTHERKLRHAKILFAKRDRSLDTDCKAYVSLSRLTTEQDALSRPTSYVSPFQADEPVR